MSAPADGQDYWASPLVQNPGHPYGARLFREILESNRWHWVLETNSMADDGQKEEIDDQLS